MNSMKRVLTGMFAMGVAILPTSIQAEGLDWISDGETFETEITVTGGWDSMYLAEGRDDLDEGGLAYGEISGAAGPFSLGTWYASATDVDYDEWNLFGELGLDLSDSLSSYVGYTFLTFYEANGDSEDHEFGAGLSFAASDVLEITVDYVFSDEADGSFVELGAASSKELSDSLGLRSYAVLGIDFGYRTEAHDGWNHFQLGIEIDYAMTDLVSIGGYVTHAIALDDIDKEEQSSGSEIGDNTAVGAYVQMSF